MTSPLVVQANPKLVHRNVPPIRRHLAGQRVAGRQHPDAVAAVDLPRAGNALLQNLVIADGLAAPTAASANAYIAHAECGSPPTCAARAPKQLFTTLLTSASWPGGASGSGPIPDGTWCRGPDRGDQRRQLREGAGAGRQHARRRQAVPVLPAAGGRHRQRRIVTTRSCSRTTSTTSRTPRRRRRSSSGFCRRTCR
jgi:hypothetical protein